MLLQYLLHKLFRIIVRVKLELTYNISLYFNNCNFDLGPENVLRPNYGIWNLLWCLTQNSRDKLEVWINFGSDLKDRVKTYLKMQKLLRLLAKLVDAKKGNEIWPIISIYYIQNSPILRALIIHIPPSNTLFRPQIFQSFIPKLFLKTRH